jgi:general stress protein YciG
MEVDIMANEGNRGGSSNRGFAAMDQEKQREIASKGGSASGGNFANDPERAREAGRKGGEVSLVATSRTTRSVRRKPAARAVRHRVAAATVAVPVAMKAAVAAAIADPMHCPGLA